MEDGMIALDAGMIAMLAGKLVILGLAIWQLRVIRRMNRATKAEQG